jgi:hypothetical protein
MDERAMLLLVDWLTYLHYFDEYVCMPFTVSISQICFICIDDITCHLLYSGAGYLLLMFLSPPILGSAGPCKAGDEWQYACLYTYSFPYI